MKQTDNPGTEASENAAKPGSEKRDGSTFFRTRYRIVHDSFAGYSAEFRPWWCPLWLECGFTNTSRTVDDAEKVAIRHMKHVVKVIR